MGHSASAEGEVSICAALGLARLCVLEAADTGSFHVDEWVFSSVLLPSYEKGDPVRRRLYEAIKNVCHFGLSNVTGKGREEKKKKKPVQKWQSNTAIFNARNSFLSTVVCSP